MIRFGTRGRRGFIAVALLAVAGGIAVWTVRRPRPTPVQRGSALAHQFGCFACHGPGGTGGVPNPGSEEGEVPSWDGGTPMMYVENDGEIREWILDGAPRRLREARVREKTSGDTRPLLAMPAYRGRISDGELEDLVAYFRAVAEWKGPEDPAARHGLEVARKLGCFGCHGPGGLAGAPNPGSLKGYIPPWQGEDFEDLVRDDGELRQWILEGKIDRLEANPAARHFSDRQVIRMPAYRGVLKEGELEGLVAYILWVQKN